MQSVLSGGIRPAVLNALQDGSLYSDVVANKVVFFAELLLSCHLPTLLQATQARNAEDGKCLEGAFCLGLYLKFGRRPPANSKSSFHQTGQHGAVQHLQELKCTC
ncbi:hypothetical protein XENORESO_019825 [Xenotaenia resolanae]|uniref:Uncharacterized protein n=1 Tax=Xenotaenia resolanae TaxID=208358 RepID=A0ABV0X1D4_9TELE